MEWVMFVLCVGLFVYGEGERALQRKWVPRLIDRAEALRDESSGWFRVLGPIYGMSLIGASRREVLRSWAVVGAILVAVRTVQALPEPWRGMIDLSVASALAWGLAGLVRAAPGAFRSEGERTAVGAHPGESR